LKLTHAIRTIDTNYTRTNAILSCHDYIWQPRNRHTKT